MSKTRRNFSKDFKAKVVLEALKERETLEVLAEKFELLPTQISLWKSEALSNFSTVFGGEKVSKDKNAVDVQSLYAQIGEQKVLIDYLKKTLL